MDFGLEGKTALVTGASRGIGFSIAKLLASNGCNVYMAARDAEALQRAVESISKESKVEIQPFVTDLSIPGAAQRLMDETKEIDILVNNAGAIPTGFLGDMTEAKYRAALETKLFSYTQLAEAAFKRMENRGGTILNVIGTAGDRPRAKYAIGSIANAALIAMTRALGLQGASCNVRVVGIHPGATLTERKINQLKARAKIELGSADDWGRLAEGYPYGRLALPDEIAQCAVFLCSGLASYVNATCLTVDGGAADHIV